MGRLTAAWPVQEIYIEGHIHYVKDVPLATYLDRYVSYWARITETACVSRFLRYEFTNDFISVEISAKGVRDVRLVAETLSVT